MTKTELKEIRARVTRPCDNCGEMSDGGYKSMFQGYDCPECKGTRVTTDPGVSCSEVLDLLDMAEWYIACSVGEKQEKLKTPDDLKQGELCLYMDGQGTQWMATFEHMTKPGRCKIMKSTDESGARRERFKPRYVATRLVSRHGWTTTVEKRGAASER